MIINYTNFITINKIISYTIALNENSNVENIYNILKLNKYILTYKNIVNSISFLIKKILSNTSLNSNLNDNNIDILSITIILIINKDYFIDYPYNKEEYNKNIQSLLEELRLNGFGDDITEILSNIIKMVLNSLKSIKPFISIDDLESDNFYNSYLRKIGIFSQENNLDINTFSKIYMGIANDLIEYSKLYGIDNILKKKINSNELILQKTLLNES